MIRPETRPSGDPAAEPEKTDPHPPKARIPIFASLEIRDFRWLWFSSFISFLAMNMQIITRGWLVLRLADDSPLALALVTMAFAVPVTLVSPIGGALADRIPKKYVIMMSHGGNTVMTSLLAVLDAIGIIEFWHLMAIGALNGCLFAINMPSRQSIISEIVPGNRLLNAISLASSGMNMTRVIGPALAGVFIIYIGTAGVLFIISGLYLLSLLTMIRLRSRKEVERGKGEGVIRDIREGLAYAKRNEKLLGLIIMICLPALFGFSFITLLPAWAREALNVRSDGLGLLMTFMGLGSLIGTLILAAMSNIGRRGIFLLAMCMAWGVFLALFSQTTTYLTAIPFLFLVGFMSATFMSLNMTLIQVYSAAEMRGRIMSISMMTFGLMPLSALPFGAIAEKIGTPDSLGLSGLFQLVSTIIFLFMYPKFCKMQ